MVDIFYTYIIRFIQLPNNHHQPDVIYMVFTVVYLMSLNRLSWKAFTILLILRKYKP